MTKTLAVAILAATAASAHAQEMDIGQREFRNNCATCHGMDGKGGGPMAALIESPLPDLTRLQKDNGGVFPYNRLYEVIDGREQVRWHGGREMPVWGQEYNAEAPQQLGYLYAPADAESFVRGRILALIGYIHTLQEP